MPGSGSRMSTSRGGSDSCSTRWCGHGSTSPRRRSGKSRIWATARAMCATSCRRISTSTTREGSAISPTPRSTFSPPSFARPRIGRRLASETAIASCRSPRSRNGRRSRKRANPGLAFRPCARFPERATRCCWCRYPAIRAGIAASPSGERTIGCSIAATPISITPKSSRTAAPRRRACAFSSRVVECRRRAATRQSGALARTRAPAGGEVKLICSHDLSDFVAMKSAQREAQAAPQPVSTRERSGHSRQQRDVRAAE